VIQECVIDRNRVGGIREGGEPGGLSWGNHLFGCPNVVRGGFCEEVGPIGSLGSFNGFEVAELGLSCCGVGIGGPQFLGFAGSLRELFSESGEERGPPCLGLWRGARAGCVVLDYRRE